MEHQINERILVLCWKKSLLYSSVRFRKNRTPRPVRNIAINRNCPSSEFIFKNFSAFYGAMKRIRKRCELFRRYIAKISLRLVAPGQFIRDFPKSEHYISLLYLSTSCDWLSSSHSQSQSEKSFQRWHLSANSGCIRNSSLQSWAERFSQRQCLTASGIKFKTKAQSCPESFSHAHLSANCGCLSNSHHQ